MCHPLAPRPDLSSISTWISSICSRAERRSSAISAAGTSGVGGAERAMKHLPRARSQLPTVVRRRTAYVSSGSTERECQCPEIYGLTPIHPRQESLDVLGVHALKEPNGR